MNKLIFIPIIIGSLLLVAGGTVFAIGVASASKNINKQTNEHELTEDFNNFNIDLTISDLEFKVSEGATKKVVCQETDKYYHEVKIENNTLKIKQIDNRKWHERIFDFSTSFMKVQVYLPAGAYNDLVIENSTGNITIPHDYSFNTSNVKLSTGDINFKANVTESLEFKTSTGNINLSDLTAKNLTVNASSGDVTANNLAIIESVNIETSTGKINLTNVTSKNLKAKASTGKINLTNVLVEEHIELNASTGDINLNDSDAKTLHIKTSTGNVKGTLLTAKRFVTHTSTGKVNVPPTDGELCEIETSTGDINIQIKA